MEKATNTIQKNQIRAEFDTKIGKLSIFLYRDGRYVSTLCSGIFKQPLVDITDLLNVPKELFPNVIKELQGAGFKMVSIKRYHKKVYYMKKFRLNEIKEKELVYVL